MNFANGLRNRGFGFDDELVAIQALEEGTPARYRFKKQEDENRAFDVGMYGWTRRPKSSESHRYSIGLIEIERAEEWGTGDIPENWKFLSFLKRKVCGWVEDFGWTGPKSHYTHAVYLKFNKSMDNAFAVPYRVIYKDGTRTPQSDGSWKDSYLELATDHSDVTWGVESCLENIVRYLVGQNRVNPKNLAI